MATNVFEVNTHQKADAKKIQDAIFALLAKEPEIIFTEYYDTPFGIIITAKGDPKHIKRLLGKIKELKNKGVTGVILQ